MARRTIRRTIRRDDEGASAVEFALLAPVFFAIIVGITQLGILFMANSGLRGAVAEGARLAQIFPTPTDQAIIDRINDRRFGLRTERMTGPTIARGTDTNGRAYADISMSYDVPLDFIFYQTPAVTLSETRRVYVQPAAAAPPSGGGTGSTSSSASTSASSTGGWGSTTSSTGGTTSTGSTTTTSTGSTTTSGGNGNGNGNGHGHGNGNGNGNGNNK